MDWRRSSTFAAAAVAVILISAVGGGTGAASSDVKGPMEIELESFAVSEPVRELAHQGGGSAGGASHPRVNPSPERTGEGGAASGPAAATPSRAAAGRTPLPGLTFDGVGNPTACGGCLPPDTVGDVGPNHYIQMVNATKVAIFNKSGTLLEPAFDMGTLWSSGDCTNNDGDPIVLYDPLANRWVLMQFMVSSTPEALCFAVSQTADPQGAYFLYQFDTPDFPDYPKLGVMPDGYYVGTNETAYSAYAFNRVKMLAGDTSAEGVRFTGETNFLLPADLDGTTPPPSAGGLFYTFKDNSFHGGADRLELFRLDPNFTNPPASTISNFLDIPIASFQYTPCGFFILDCISQPGTIQGLDPVGEWPMHRLVYRRFPNREVLLGTFTVGGAAAEDGAAPRWFELRNTGAGFTLFQEGTHDPADNHNRWMGSIAMDGDGNIALGYSVSSSTLSPSIRYATRTPSDPPGTLQTEQTLQAGGGSQTSAANRWGDYSSMNVDPSDGCTFWYTNEYYSSTSASTWSTRIGNFKEPSCPVGDADGDGVTDNLDACPNQAGTLPNGCPDSDGDGVQDSLDPCPNTAGPNGCPVNDITFGKAKLNKKKGTATLSVIVPGGGELDLGGKNIKPINRPLGGATRGTHARPVTGAGTETLKIKPKGKAKKKLKKKGKAKVKPQVTFTPTGGFANTETTKVKLKKKRKRK